MYFSHSDLKAWLIANKEKITHFRPRKWCGVEMLLPYNRREKTPLIECPLIIADNQENSALIREILGDGKLEEPFAGTSNKY
jgi:hypothetical protein